MLGLGNHRFHLGSCVSFTLDSVLKIVTLLVVASMIHSTIVRKSFMLSRNLWCIFVSLSQAYVIDLSRKQDELNSHNHNMVSSSSSAVRLFDKLSKLQIVPALVCFVERSFDVFGIELIQHFDSVTLMLDEVINLLFYAKVLLIKENADVNVELVQV